MMENLKTRLEIIAETKYPIPEKCCRLKLRAVLEKRKLFIERLINESERDSEITSKGFE
jgi:hypothetical protein